jgi:hypothetical protein
MEDEQEALFAGTVEATRAGMIFSHPEATRQYNAWRRRTQAAVKRARGSTESIGLTGQALESAIMGFAALHPEYVVVGGE